MTTGSIQRKAPRIALAPYELKVPGRLADVPLTQLTWYLETPPTAGTVSDLEVGDHLIFYVQRRLLLEGHGLVRCHLTPLLAEPLELYRRFYVATALVSWRWFRIFTHQSAFLKLVPNSRFWPLGNSWVGNPPAELCIKSRRMSLIASSKTTLRGHRMRHEVAEWITATGAEVDLLGLAYKPFQHKIDGLAPYQFSVVIENARDRGYFTEKLIDAFLCRTIPIYWGAPDIDRFFDTRGMIICETAEEVKKAVASANDDTYASMRDAIERNHRAAQGYLSHDRNAVKLLRREIGASDDRARV